LPRKGAPTPGRLMGPHRYLILVGGELTAADQEGLSDLAMERTADIGIALRGDLDQSALLCVMWRLRHLAIEVIEVHRICPCASPRETCVAIAKRRLIPTR
jgi:hypothetical protein